MEAANNLRLEFHVPARHVTQLQLNYAPCHNTQNLTKMEAIKIPCNSKRTHLSKTLPHVPTIKVLQVTDI
jgi:hypothetical protein